MLIKKLICTKSSYYFRKVSNLTKHGLYLVEYEDEFCMFDNKKQLYTVDEMFDAICKHREAYIRNQKIETILK